MPRSPPRRVVDPTVVPSRAREQGGLISPSDSGWAPRILRFAVQFPGSPQTGALVAQSEASLTCNEQRLSCSQRRAPSLASGKSVARVCPQREPGGAPLAAEAHAMPDPVPRNRASSLSGKNLHVAYGGDPCRAPLTVEQPPGTDSVPRRAQLWPVRWTPSRARPPPPRA